MKRACIPIYVGAMAFLATSPAAAQGLYVPAPTIDTSQLATRLELTAAQAAMCTPMAAVPPGETVGGSAGSGNTCRLANAVQPRITRATIVSTIAGGSFSGTWATALTSAPIIVLTPIATGALPVHCELTAVPTATTFQGRCVTIAVASILAVGAGQQVQVTALPPTQ